MTRPERLSTAALALAAAALALWMGLSIRAFLPRSRAVFDVSPADQGEALRHAAHPPETNVSFRMPVGPLFESDGLLHRSAGAQRAWVAALLALSWVLTVALGCLLAGPWAGLLGALVWQVLLWSSPPSTGFYKQFLVTLYMLVVAATLVWRARRPGLRTTAMLSAAIGASLLMRTSLVLFGPCLALYEWLAARRARAKPRPRELAALALGPLLFLLPWALFNGVVHRELVVLERGAANMNLALGALGSLNTAHGDFATLVDEPVDRPYRPLLGWAVRRSVEHPLAFARAFARRIWRVVGLNPWLYLVGLAALAALRRLPEFRALWLLVAYFIAFNCLMSIEDYLFEPLRPLLAAAAAGALAAVLRPARLAATAWAERGARAAAAAGLAAALLASLGALGATAAYAVRFALRPPHSDAALEDGLRRSPGDAWLLHERGKRRLGEGRVADALSDLSAAAAARPDIPRLALELAWARMETGDLGPLLAQPCWKPEGDPSPDPFHDRVREQACLYRALAFHRRGRDASAQDELETALALWRRSQSLTHAPRDELERDLQRRLRDGGDERFLRRLEQLLYAKPARARLEALELLDQTRPGNRAILSELARAAIEAGDLARADRALRALARVARDPAYLHQLALLYQDAGRLEAALAALSRLSRLRPTDPVYLKDRGVCEFRLGRAEAARRSLASAHRLDPASPQIALSLGAVLAASGRRREALAVYDRTLAIAARGTELAGVLARSRDELGQALK